MSPKQNNRRILRMAPLFVVAFLVSFLAINALWPRAGAKPADDGKLRFVCTFLPVYVFTQNVVGDAPEVDVQLLVDRDVGCPHSYSLTGQDLKKLSRASLVVANGLGAEPFLGQVTRGRKDLKVLTISDDCEVIGGQADNSASAPQAEHADHDHDEHAPAEAGHEGHQDHDGHNHDGHDHEGCTDPSHNHTDHAHHEHDSDVNPHTWVSPREAIKQVRTLARKLSQEHPERTEQFQANAEAYVQRLESLAEQMEAAAKSFTNRNIVTGHASFDYLARDLGLNVVATLRVIPGETGSALELARVIDAVRQNQVAAIFWEPPFGDKVADTVARETGVPAYPLNPFNTDAGLPEVSSPEQSRRMYEEVMQQNLVTLQKALGGAPARVANQS